MNKLAQNGGKLSVSLFSSVQNNAAISYVAKARKSGATAALKYYTAVTGLFLMQAMRKLNNQIKGKNPPPKKEHPRDVVILYQFPRAFNTPSLSPFALKLETWCRAAGIPYQNELGMKTSSQGLIPFIKLNDFVVEDSQKCIEYLSNVMNVDLNSDLTAEQKAISRSVLKMIENSTHWSMVYHRFWYSDITKKETRLPTFAIWMFGYRIYRLGKTSGALSVPKYELYENGKKDLTALNVLVGKKKYLFSDSKPCDTDFALFGLCAQFLYNEVGPLHFHLKNDCPNLLRHAENIKNTYWKDWDSNIMASRVKKSNFNLSSMISGLLKPKQPKQPTLPPKQLKP